MPDHSGKLEIFTQAVLREANEDAKNIRERLKAKHDEEIRRARQTYKAESERWLEAQSAELTAQEMCRVSTRMAENKRRLLDFRESCAKAVFSRIPEKVGAFTASPDYAPHMAVLLKKAYEALGQAEQVELWLREEDQTLWPALRDSLPGTEITLRQGDFHLGGLCLTCPERGMRADLTFDSAMADLEGHFSELSGMHIN